MKALYAAAAALIAVVICSFVVALALAVVRSRQPPAVVEPDDGLTANEREGLEHATRILRASLLSDMLARDEDRIHIETEFSEGRSILRLYAIVEGPMAGVSQWRSYWVAAYNIQKRRMMFIKQEMQPSPQHQIRLR